MRYDPRPVVLAVLLFGLAPLASSAAPSETKLLDSAGDAGDHLGWSVAMDGNYAIVGAPFDDTAGSGAGKAVIFHWNGSSWVQEASLYPTLGTTDAGFGYSVDISGDFAVVGAAYPVQTGVGAGRAYVYQRSGSVWNPHAILSPPDLSLDDRFGRAVAIDGDQLLVSAPLQDHVQTDAGAVYTFERSGSAWNQLNKIQNPSGTTRRYFGTSVDLDGLRGAISAFEIDDALSAVTAVQRIGNLWLVDQTFSGWDTDHSDQFGVDLAISGTRILSGANIHQHPPSDGAAYVYERGLGGGSSWTFAREFFELSLGGLSDNMGRAVGLDADIAAVGSPWGDGLAPDSGLAYVYRRDGVGDWAEVATLGASDGFTGQSFASALDVSGSCVIAGAPSDTQNGSFAGAAYVYCGMPPIFTKLHIDIICCIKIPDYTTAPVEFEIRITNPTDVTQPVVRWVELRRPDGGIVEVAAPAPVDVRSGETVSEMLQTLIREGDPLGYYHLVSYWQDAGEAVHTEIATFEVVSSVAVPVSSRPGLAVLVGTLWLAGCLASVRAGRRRRRGSAPTARA